MILYILNSEQSDYIIMYWFYNDAYFFIFVFKETFYSKKMLQFSTLIFFSDRNGSVIGILWYQK